MVLFAPLGVILLILPRLRASVWSRRQDDHWTSKHWPPSYAPPLAGAPTVTNVPSRWPFLSHLRQLIYETEARPQTKGAQLILSNFQRRNVNTSWQIVEYCKCWHFPNKCCQHMRKYCDIWYQSFIIMAFIEMLIHSNCRFALGWWDVA